MRSGKLFYCICLLGLTIVGCGQSKAEIPYITDGSADWDSVTEIAVYSDGYYGRTLDEPLIVTDEEKISDLVKWAADADKYKIAEDGGYLEGLSGLFVDFGNGVVISMYEDVNYGTVSGQMEQTGSPCFYVPEELWQEVRGLLEWNLPK